MSTLSVRHEIEELCKTLHIPKDKLFEVKKNQWRSILDKVEDTFLIKTHYSQGLHWGWNRLKEPNFAVGFKTPTYKFFDYFKQDENIWFITEDLYDKMWVYEGESNTIFNQVIPELYQLKEYYLVSKKFTWLFCENHHGIICLSGEEIIGRVKTFVKENSELIIDRKC